MANTVDPTEYTLVPYKMYETFQDKLRALMDGEILLIKNFERKSQTDVLARLNQKKYIVSQISYDMSESEEDPRHWVIFNIGINDLSLFSVFQFDEEIALHTNLYVLNDVVTYLSVDGTADSAIIEEVYQNRFDPSKYAYRLSREPDSLYAEEDLIKHKYL